MSRIAPPAEGISHRPASDVPHPQLCGVFASAGGSASSSGRAGGASRGGFGASLLKSALQKNGAHVGSSHGILQDPSHTRDPQTVERDPRSAGFKYVQPPHAAATRRLHWCSRWPLMVADDR
jgi:hypothetical protein